MAAAETGSLDATGSRSQRNPEFDDPPDNQRPPILMIGRDATLMKYKAAVLATANLSTDTAFPVQAQATLRDGANYELIILSHTLDPDEALNIHQTVRARNSRTRLLLMLGPGGTPLDCGLFDAALRGLDGPAALVAKVQEMLQCESTPCHPA